MRVNMQRIKQLVELLDNTDDESERESIQDEIWTLEEELEYEEGEVYKSRHTGDSYEY